MNKTLKAQWVSALRSGEYERITYYLKKHVIEGDRYCCLGVLCDISQIGEWEGSTYRTKSVYSNDAILPPSVIRKAKFSREVERQLAHMNDAPQGDFLKIADWIEENL